MKVYFLMDNKTENPNCVAEWGLSMWIETGDTKLLFDVGASNLFIKNAKAMNIDLSEAEFVAISHGHYDHTEGMQGFVEINKTAPIYLHKEAFYECHGLNSDGKIEDYNCGILWSNQFKEELKPRIIPTENTVKIKDNIYLLGNIPDLKEYPPTEQFYRRVEKALEKDLEKDSDKALEKDPMNHEQALVIIEEKDNIPTAHIISGCCHKGVIPTLNHVKSVFPHCNIGSFIAGMHLYSQNDQKLDNIVGKVLDFGVEKVFPLHCTGMNGIIKFKEVFKDRCLVATSGDVYEL